MKNITEKNSLKRGASLMIALVIFLLCALAGVSAFFMASTNVGRYSHASDQEYYSVSSAALMIVDMLDDFTYTSQPVNYDYEREWDFTGDAHTSKDTYTLTVPNSESSKGTTTGASTLSKSKLKLCTTIQDQCDKLVPYLNIPDEWYARVKGTPNAPTRPESVASTSYDFDVTVKDNDKKPDERFGTVKCKLVMGSNYDLLFTFQSESGEYAVTVYWVAEVDPAQTTGNPEYVYAEDSAIVGGEYTKGFMRQKRTLTVTVTWKYENATISRGEAINETSNKEEKDA